MKGAVWTVDDEEYHRRRPPRGIQSSGGAGSGNSGPGAASSPTLTPSAPSMLDQSLSSMLAAAQERLPFFNHAALMEQARRSGSAAFPQQHDLKAAGGMDSPPQSLDNRSVI